MNGLSLETAKAYKAVGGPQERPVDSGGLPIGRIVASTMEVWIDDMGDPHVRYRDGADFIYAPDHLTALNWFEQKKGVQYGIRLGGQWFAGMPKNFGWVWKAIVNDSLDDLIIQICQRLLQEAGQ